MLATIARRTSPLPMNLVVRARVQSSLRQSQQSCPRQFQQQSQY